MKELKTEVIINVHGRVVIAARKSKSAVSDDVAALSACELWL
jgi:hypothetical protein